MLSLSDYISREFTVGGTRSHRIILFDVDDTLIHTTAHILVRKNGKVVKRITNAEFNEYVLQPGESFDFAEFDDPKILDNEEFTPYWNTLKREYKKGTHIGILTARGDTDMIHKFFKKKGIDIKYQLIFAVGDPKLKLNGTIAERKADIISKLVKLGYKTFVFFDDNESNLQSAKQLESRYNIKVVTVKA